MRGDESCDLRAILRHFLRLPWRRRNRGIGDRNDAHCKRIWGRTWIHRTFDQRHDRSGSGARHNDARTGRCSCWNCGTRSSTANAATCDDTTLDSRDNAAGANDSGALNRDATLDNNASRSRADARTGEWCRTGIARCRDYSNATRSCTGAAAGCATCATKSREEKAAAR